MSKGIVVVAALLGLGLIYFAYKRPQIAIVSWVVITACIPFWSTVYVGVGLPPSSAYGLPVLLGVAASFKMGSSKAKLHWLDLSLGVGAAIILFLWLSGELQGTYFLRDLLMLWTLAYLLGRMANGRTISVAYPVVMAVVAAWGLIEFTFGMHLFTEWMPSATHTLNRIQERAGFARSEAAFGHAIAYGGALALALPYAQRLPRYSALVQFLLIGGIVVSLSRGPLLALVVTLALCVWVLSSRRHYVRNVMLTLGGGVAAYYILTSLYSGAYSDEVTGSGNARVSQLLTVQDRLRWLSSALTFTGPQGEPTVAGVKIIDSTPIRLAVNFGIVAAIAILVPVLVAAVRAINRKAGPASVALAGQIPILVVTSFITQWQVLIFFFMGLVTSEILSTQEPKPTENPENSAGRFARAAV